MCIRNHIKTVQTDYDKISSIRKMCSIRLKMLNEDKLTDDTAFVIAERYYEIIKELLIALLLKNNMKSDNHECLIAFFKYKYPQYASETETIHQLKAVRNRVSYDGIFIKKSYIDRNRLEFQHIIKEINGLLDVEV